VVVHYNYGWNWTALFCTGDRLWQPRGLAETVWLFKDSAGYDGQMYHYIAHDPFFQRSFDRYVDAPRLRYRRILLPGLAYLLAIGQGRFIDAAYIGLVLASISLGWLARPVVRGRRQFTWWISAWYLEPAHYDLPWPGALIGSGLDYAALAGIGVAVFWVVVLLAAIYAFAGLTAALYVDLRGRKRKVSVGHQLRCRSYWHWLDCESGGLRWGAYGDDDSTSGTAVCGYRPSHFGSKVVRVRSQDRGAGTSSTFNSVIKPSMRVVPKAR